MSQFPGSTFASEQSAKLAYKNRAIRRSKYIAKKRAMYNPIQKKTFGKSIVTKFTYVTSMNITSISDYSTVYGLVSLMQASADWPNFRDGYALFNILHISVDVYPQKWEYSQGVDRMACICYDLKDSAALNSLNSGADHDQHLLIPFTGAVDRYHFTTKTRSIGAVPQSTGVSTETWGWIKGYADNGDFGNLNISIGKITFTLTVCFSQAQ